MGAMRNEEVWFFDSYGNPRNGHIDHILKGAAQDGPEPADPWVEVRVGEHARWTVRLSACHPTRTECLDAEQNRAKQTVETYKQNIRSAEELVAFCLDHCVAKAEEYTDWDAREAAIQKAREFGIDIDGE